MIFFENCMESVFEAMNVRRSGPEDAKETYVDMTMLVEIPNHELVADIDPSLASLMFDEARLAVKQAAPSSKIYFPRQTLAFATMAFETQDDVDVALLIESASVKVKMLYPANEDGHGASIKLQFSFVVPEKRHLALLAELIGEPVWFLGVDSLVQDEQKKSGGDSDDVVPLKGQEKLFPDKGITSITIEAGGKSVTATPEQFDRALRSVK